MFAPPIPWGLLAALGIAVTVAGSGWYLLHELRRGDAAEIQALADVADRNAEAVRRERASAASYAANASKATKEQADAHRRTQDALDALRAQWDAKATDDPCRLCTLDWPAGGLHED